MRAPIKRVFLGVFRAAASRKPEGRGGKDSGLKDQGRVGTHHPPHLLPWPPAVSWVSPKANSMSGSTQTRLQVPGHWSGESLAPHGPRLVPPFPIGQVGGAAFLGLSCWEI